MTKKEKKLIKQLRACIIEATRLQLALDKAKKRLAPGDDRLYGL